jgi:hypothetical protein
LFELLDAVVIQRLVEKDAALIVVMPSHRAEDIQPAYADDHLGCLNWQFTSSEPRSSSADIVDADRARTFHQHRRAYEHHSLAYGSAASTGHINAFPETRHQS